MRYRVTYSGETTYDVDDRTGDCYALPRLDAKLVRVEVVYHESYEPEKVSPKTETFEADAIPEWLNHELDRGELGAQLRSAREFGCEERDLCECGRILDANGEHDGGYGAFCG